MPIVLLLTDAEAEAVASVLAAVYNSGQPGDNAIHAHSAAIKLGAHGFDVSGGDDNLEPVTIRFLHPGTNMRRRVVR